ncbi:MAG TPA: rRNA maturation RNase YbeY [Campylobacterales bacterium]|nr:rRNA maturation RNase YbeY [Campylobacterales bacterium]
MIVLDDRYGYDIALEKLEKIKTSLTSKEIELIFMSDGEISEINAEFRDKDSATDVLSFPLEEMPNTPLGTIVISIDKVKQLADELGHSEDDELFLLFIHGLLHLLGYDHEEDTGEMREKEKQMIEDFGLPNSLIIRYD